MVSAFAGRVFGPTPKVINLGARAPALDGARFEADDLTGAVTASARGHGFVDELQDHLSFPSSVSSSSAAWPSGNKS